MAWTRVGDDSGGGQSATGHEILYFEGDELDVQHCILALGCRPDASTPEYGSYFNFKAAESFADLTWFERG